MAGSAEAVIELVESEAAVPQDGEANEERGGQHRPPRQSEHLVLA